VHAASPRFAAFTHDTTGCVCGHEGRAPTTFPQRMGVKGEKYVKIFVQIFHEKKIFMHNFEHF